MNIAVLADQWVKLKESEKRDKYQDFARGMKNLWDMKVMVIPHVIGSLSTATKGLVQGLKDMEIRGRVEIGQYTEKSPGDLRRLAVTQTPVEGNQQALR